MFCHVYHDTATDNISQAVFEVLHIQGETVRVRKAH
jgi:hypothetical protein